MSVMSKKQIKSGQATVDLARQHIAALANVWASVPVDRKSVAASDYQKVDVIAQALISRLPALASRNVLDIGCNSGLYSLLISKYANRVVGSDVKSGYIDRANAAKRYFTENVYNVDNVEFICGNFSERLNESVDAIVASRVLYHLGDQNVKLLGEFLSKGPKSVLIQARPQRADKFKKHPEWHTVSTTKVYNGLYKVEDCLEFLRDCGFAEAEISSMGLVTNGEHFPVIYATK